MSLTIIICFLLLVFLLVWKWYTIVYLTHKRSKIPYMSFFTFASIGARTPVVNSVVSQSCYKDFFSAWLGPFYSVLAVDPDAAKFVLKDPRFKKLGLFLPSKKADIYFGKHLQSTDGEDWRRHKALVGNGFTAGALSSYYPNFVNLTEKAIGKLQADVDVEIHSFFSSLTLDVLGVSIFNHDFQRLDGKNDKYYQAYRSIMDPLNNPYGIALRMFPFLEKWPIRWIKDYTNAVDTLIEFFSKMIEAHKGDNSIISHLMMGSENQALSREELLGNIWIFFLAGHETTANALTWCLNCLREYPDIQEKLYQEIKDKIGLDQIPTEEQLNEMVYLDCFINEVLRLHSPVSLAAAREATEDVPYKDKVILKGSRVGIFLHILHTNPNYWDDPLEFRPERFTAENKKGRNHFLYIPFSEGPRKCIGASFSLLEQKLFVTRLLQQYQVVNPVDSKIHPINELLILFSENNVPIRFKNRENRVPILPEMSK